MTQNMQTGGFQNSEGVSDEDRWSQLMAVVREVAPDVLLAQELQGWDDHNEQHLAEAQRAMGMEIAGGLTPCRSGNGTGVFINRKARLSQWETKNAFEVYHGLGVVVLNVDGVDIPLTAISAHLNPFSCAQAAQEAQIVIARAWRYKGLAIVGGDINHFPLDDRAPDPDDIPPYNRSSRWLMDEHGAVQPNRLVGRTLALGGLTDVALHLHQQTGEESYLAPTGRGGVRVDQVHVTPALLPAIVSYERLTHGHSDHAGILVEFDPRKIDTKKTLKEYV